MNRDFQNDQSRSRSTSVDEEPQSSPAVTTNPNEEAFLAQLAAMSGLLQLPAGESPFHTPDPLTQSYMQQHLPSLSSHLYEQPIPGPSSHPNVSSFPSTAQWAPSYQDLINSLLSTSPPGSSMASPATSLSTDMATELGALDDERAAAEEKRRRNTAASARFRIKKKQRAINLERSVSDLTGRADELEREAADLRRENGWLKEIVMLKGTQFAALNLAQHLEVMNQISKQSKDHSVEPIVEEESDEDEEDEATSDKKGKGKSKRS